MPRWGRRSCREIARSAGRRGISAAPARAAEIAEKYRAASRELAQVVRAQWTDATLQTEFQMHGMHWTRGLMLAIFVRHEIHHRAQIQILMRQAGLKVPSVYGPSRDEPWPMPDVAQA